MRISCFQKLGRLPCLIAILVAASPAYGAQKTLVLRNAFINQLEDRATLTTNLRIDAVTRRHAQSDDGDRHIIARSDAIGLRVIAEIKNAASFTAAENLAIDNIDGTLEATGMWRLWFEHPDALTRQGDPVTPGTAQNQNHVFELHPVLQIGTEELDESVGTIDGFLPFTGHYAFFNNPTRSYARGQITISRTASWTTIKCDQKAYNHVLVEATMISRRPTASGDGTFAYVQLALNNDDIRMRIVTAEGTEADDRINRVAPGKRFIVLGIPRMNLSWIASLPRDGVERSYMLSEHVGNFMELIALQIQAT